MASNLLIVESPAKAKTLKKYLGNDFEVLATFGHVRDLIPKTGAIDTENGFAMQYETIARNSKHVDAIAKAAAAADHIYLATDPDREGEAIAWHVAELLKAKRNLKGKSMQRQSQGNRDSAGKCATSATRTGLPGRFQPVTFTLAKNPSRLVCRSRTEPGLALDC